MSRMQRDKGKGGNREAIMARNVDAGGLTPAQANFAAGIARLLTQAEAYRKASLLAANGEVQARVSAPLARGVERAELDGTEVLRELKCLCLSDISGNLHEDGRVKLPQELDEDTRRAVESFEIDDLGRVKYRFWEKNAALEKAMRQLGMFERDSVQGPELVGRVELVPMTKQATTAVSEMQSAEGREA